MSSEHSAFRSTPVAGTGTRFYTLISGSSFPVHRVSRMRCFLWTISRFQRWEQRRWLFRFYLSTEKTTIHPLESFQAWHSHGVLGRVTQLRRATISPHCDPAQCVQSAEDEAKGNWGQGTDAYSSFSQDNRAARTLFKDVALPLCSERCLFCQCCSIRMKHTSLV